MTFSKSDLDGFGFDSNAPCDDGMCYCTGLQDFAARVFNVDLDVEFPDGWIDVRAYFEEGRVKEMVFTTCLNDVSVKDRELDIVLNDRKEGRKLFQILKKGMDKTYE